MAAGSTTRRTSRVTNRTTRAGGGGGPRGGGSMMGLLGAIVVVVLILGGMAIYLKMEGDRKAAEANRTVGVVSAAVDLPAGRQLTSQDLTLKQVHPNSVEAASFSDVSDPSLIGETLAINVSANQTITRNLLGGAVEEKLMPAEGESSVALVLKGSDAVQPFLQKSKIVSVFRVFTTASGNRIIKSLSKRARILDVKKSDSALENAQKGGTETLVTLALSPADAQQVNTYKDEATLVDGPDQEPPLSNITLLTYWQGIEPEDMEITPEVGASKINKEESSGGGKK